MPSIPPSRCWLLPARGTGTGLGLVVLLLLGGLTVDVSVCLASCGHYVRDRLNPHIGPATSELPVWAAVSLGGKWGVWRLPIDVLVDDPGALFSGALHPGVVLSGGPFGPQWPVAPCRGPGCRGPVLPLAPSGLATAVVPADDSQSAATPAHWSELALRPIRPRGPRPESECLPSSLPHGLFKPPC